MDMKPYVVRQGDFLSKIAHRFGCTAKDIWEHPKNKKLATKRKNPNVLCPGDLLYVPDCPASEMPFKPGAENNYVASVPKIDIELKLLDADGQALSGKKYWVHGLPDESDPAASGSLDGEGAVKLKVPLTVRELSIVIEGDEVVRRVLIGHLDPVEESTGHYARLTLLGFCPDEEALVPPDMFTAEERQRVREYRLPTGVAAFRTSIGETADSGLDEKTLAKLEKEFGN